MHRHEPRWSPFVALTLVATLGGAMARAERVVRLDGDVQVVQIDDFAGDTSRVVHELHGRRSNRVVELILPEGTPVLRTGMRIQVRGALGRPAGTTREVLAVGGEAGAIEVVSEPASPAAVAGTRNAIVLVVDFAQDAKTVSCTDAAIEGRMFTADPSVDRLYQEASFSQLSWPRDTDGDGLSDVFRVSIDDAGNDCDTTTWRSKADAAATALGANLSLYQHRVYVLPATVACSWAGYAVIGCSSSCWAMVATCDRGDVYAHELGHNLGMRHASFDVDVDGIVDATCPWGGWSGGGEYCDDSDFMGISTNVWRQTNAPHKVQMGWVPSDRVVDVTSSGTYTIAPLEVYPGTTGLPLVLRIAKPGGYYYASYRRRLGYDAAMRLAYADRTSVHGHGGGNTMLHAYLGDGQAFQDSGNGIGIAQVAHDVGAVQIAVTLECGNGVIDAGEQCDGTNLGGATCGGCAGTPTCTTGCQLSYAACTNGVCDASETCGGCAQDCVGGARCGNGVCEVGDGESCLSCPTDCAGVQAGNPASRFCCGNAGTNPIGCEPARCGASCTLASVVVCCGDAVCSGSETASTCDRDCAPAPGGTTTTSTSSSTSTSTTSSTSSSTTTSSTTSTTTSVTSSSTISTTTSSSTSSTSVSSTSTSSSTTSSSSSTSSTSTSTSTTSSTTTSTTTSTTSVSATSSTTSTTTSTTLPEPGATSCPPAPLPDCRASASQRARLILRTTRGSGTVVRWKLANGGVIAADELTVPSIAAAELRLCVYDASGAPQPVASVGVASGQSCGVKPCWRATGSSAGAIGLRYRNKEGLPAGVTAARLRTNRAVLDASLKARGPALSASALPVTVPVTAQLIVGDGARPLCWQAVLATAHRNDAAMVKVAQP